MKRFLLILIMVALTFGALHAETSKRPMWSAEVKTGFWMPTDDTTKVFIDNCCNVVFGINSGFLYHGRYGVEGGVGVLSKSGRAVGETTGAASSDKFNLFLLPMETNLVWRIDYAPNQIVVPYIKAGVDYVFFRESFMGDVTKGLKTGMHTNGGVQFLLKDFDQDRGFEDAGVINFYTFLEARYGWVNSFGDNGLDLSGPIYSLGLLFEF